MSPIEVTLAIRTTHKDHKKAMKFYREKLIYKYGISKNDSDQVIKNYPLLEGFGTWSYGVNIPWQLKIN